MALPHGARRGTGISRSGPSANGVVVIAFRTRSVRKQKFRAHPAIEHRARPPHPAPRIVTIAKRPSSTGRDTKNIFLFRGMSTRACLPGLRFASSGLRSLENGLRSFSARHGFGLEKRSKYLSGGRTHTHTHTHTSRGTSLCVRRSWRGCSGCRACGSVGPYLTVIKNDARRACPPGKYTSKAAASVPV